MVILEQDVRSDSALLEELIGHLPQVAYVINIKNGAFNAYDFVSPYVRQLLGYDPEDFYDAPGLWRSRILVEDIDLLSIAVKSVLSGHAAEFIYRMRHRNGRDIISIRDKMIPKKDRRGTCTTVMGFAAGINDEQSKLHPVNNFSLRHSANASPFEGPNRIIKGILNRIPIDIVLFNPDHKYVFISENAVRDESVRNWLIGKDDFDYCTRKGLDYSIAENRRKLFLETIATRKEVEWMEEHAPKKNLAKRYVLRKFFPYYEDGELIYVIGYGIDVTSLKQAEINLVEKEGYLRTLIDSIPDLIIRADINGRCLDYKTQHPELLAIKPEDFLGKTLHEFWPDTTVGFHLEQLQKALDSDETITYEYQLSLPTGEKRWFEERVKADRKKEFVILIRDITDKKRAEEEREQLIRDLTYSNNELMQFSYIVSHNLRHPVANMLGITSLMPTATDVEKVEMTEFIRQSAESMDGMLKDLNVSLTARTPLNERIEAFAITPVLDIILGNLATHIGESGTQINVNIDDNALELRSIKSYVQSSVCTLVSNAIKYKSATDAPVINIDAWRDSVHYYITVSDNGLGIDMEKYGTELFGLYKRFHTETEGKGLGLHLARTKVESLGGKISVDSNPGEGSRFTIMLKHHL